VMMMSPSKDNIHLLFHNERTAERFMELAKVLSQQHDSAYVMGMHKLMDGILMEDSDVLKALSEIIILTKSGPKKLVLGLVNAEKDIMEMLG